MYLQNINTIQSVSLLPHGLLPDEHSSLQDCHRIDCMQQGFKAILHAVHGQGYDFLLHDIEQRQTDIHHDITIIYIQTSNRRQ